MTQLSPATDARWLDALQRLAGRAAHEVKGALNGVSVNLEVIRSRAERPNAAAATLSSFAEAASAQLDDVIELTEALLGLTRSSREPVEIGVELRRIVSLLSAVARAEGHRLSIEEDALARLGVTQAPGSAVRLAICDCLLIAIDASARTRCTARNDNGTAVLRIEAADGATIALPSDVVATAAESGIDLQAERSAISISFPGDQG